MKLQINYKYLAAEFIVVVVGILVALATDSWLQNRTDRQAETEYLNRLYEEVQNGLEAVDMANERYRNVSAAANEFVNHIESGSLDIGDRELVSLFAASSIVGLSQNFLHHDVTYREMVSTGNLSLIKDANLRRLIDEYYRRIYITQTTIDRFDDRSNRRFSELTGSTPGRYYRTGDVVLTESAIERIAEEVRTNDELYYSINSVRTQTYQLDIFLNMVYETRENLMTALEAQIL